MTALATTAPTAYWYLARGTGAVALVLLTVSVVLGILGSVRFTAGPRWPRFAIDTLHRDVSLLVIAVLVIHILTSVLDAFAPISLAAAVIPFISPYRPLWLGLGAVAFDLLLALVLTSLFRRRVGYRGWRMIHWLAYASWPVAVLHGLGTGTDTKVWWMLLLTAACVVAVTVATLMRIARSDLLPQGARTWATAGAVAAPVAIAIFTLAGPLQTGWARRAGTPARLLAPSSVASAATARTVSTGPKLKAPFTASLTGTATQTLAAGGEIVDISLQLGGGAQGQLRIRLGGAPLAGAGLSMTGSQVDLEASGLPTVLQGHIVSLEGQEFVAHVSGSGTALSLHARLDINGHSGAVSGSLRALPMRTS